MPVTIKRNKITSIKDFEKQFKESKKSAVTSGPLYPTRVGYKGRNTMTVRLLAEPDQWINYNQYWDPSLNRPVIQTEENEDEYTERNIRPSVIHLAPALDVENGQVIVLELKWSLIKQIERLRQKQNEKTGATLTEYDIELEKTGSGKEGTEYFATYDGKAPIDLSKYPVPAGFTDWQDYLWKFLDRLVGNDDDEDDDELEDDEEETEEDDSPFVEPATTEEAPVAKKVVRRVGVKK